MSRALVLAAVAAGVGAVAVVRRRLGSAGDVRDGLADRIVALADEDAGPAAQAGAGREPVGHGDPLADASRR